MDTQKVKAILFDLDGTLLDTVKDIGTGANLALCRYGCPEYPLDAFCGYVGHGIRMLFRQIVPEGIDEETFEKILAFYLDYYPKNCTIHTEFFPGIPEMMSQLQAAGYRLAVISNKTETTTRKIIDHFFPETEFAFVWGNNGKRPLKPATDAGLLACETLGLSPAEILFFGDGDTDMEFASAMGFLPVACSWGYRSEEALRKAGAKHIVHSADQLTELLCQ